MARFLATALAAMTACLHIVVGTPDVMEPAFEAALPPEVIGTLHACWHFVSVFLVMSAYVFWRNGPAARAFAWLWMGFAGTFLAAGLWQDGLRGAIYLPQWVLLALAGALAVRAVRKKA